MVMVTLGEVVTKNQNVLGTGFEKLGKGIYLSFDKEGGWSVKRFDGCCGFVQRFFRWLGFYASTHLKNVVGQLRKEAEVAPGLKNKIEACWKRHGGAGVAAPRIEVVPLAPVNEPVRRFVPGMNAANQLGIFIGDTHVSIEQGDIINPRWVTTIVNAANETCLGGGGIDGVIHRAAGPELLAECRRLPERRPGVRCETGGAVITKSGQLGGVQRIIHAVGPRYDAANPARSAALLRDTYISSLNVAHANGVRSIAFPAISTGIFGFPFGAATRIAIDTVEEYAEQNPGRFDEIKLVFIGNAYGEARGVWDLIVHRGIWDNFMG